MSDDPNNCINDQEARMKMLTDRDKDKDKDKDDGITEDSWNPPAYYGYYATSYPEGIKLEETPDLQTLIKKVISWHHDRNLIKGSSDKDQTLKLLQELGELSDSVCKGKDIKDDIGDMLVVMLNITSRNNVSLEECLAKAWEDIKDRKGRMIDGIFVKETDL